MEPTIFQRLGVDDGDRLVEFGGDVEQAVFGAKDGKMGPDAVAEVDICDYLGLGDVDDHHVRSVAAGLTHAGIPVDGDIGQLAVGRGDNLVTGVSAKRTRETSTSVAGSKMASLLSPFWTTSSWLDCASTTGTTKNNATAAQPNRMSFIQTSLEL